MFHFPYDSSLKIFSRSYDITSSLFFCTDTLFLDTNFLEGEIPAGLDRLVGLGKMQVLKQTCFLFLLFAFLKTDLLTNFHTI